MKLFSLISILGALSIYAESTELSQSLDIAYKDGASLTDYEKKRCKLDVYSPSQAKDLPCVVWFHGGGLTGGSKSTQETIAIAKALANEGLVVAVVNYRLSPEAKYPAYLDDAAASVAWVHQHAGEYGGNAKQLYVIGHSAGGYLAAMIGVDERLLKKYGLSPQDLAGVVPLSGQMATHYTIREERGLPRTTIIIDEASPINHASKDTPPFLILYAEKDMSLRDIENQYFAAALRAAGNKQFSLHEMKGHDHGGIGNNIRFPDDTVKKAIVDFINANSATK